MYELNNPKHFSKTKHNRQQYLFRRLFSTRPLVVYIYKIYLFYRPPLTPSWAWGGQPGRRLAPPYSGFCLLKNHYSPTTKTFELGINCFNWVNLFIYKEIYLPYFYKHYDNFFFNTITNVKFFLFFFLLNYLKEIPDFGEKSFM